MFEIKLCEITIITKLILINSNFNNWTKLVVISQLLIVVITLLLGYTVMVIPAGSQQKVVAVSGLTNQSQ